MHIYIYIKVCEAMERMAGWPFIKRVFSRMDCKDGHPNFGARKSLEFVCQQLKAQDGLDWVEVNRTIMFDDDVDMIYTYTHTLSSFLKDFFFSKKPRPSHIFIRFELFLYTLYILPLLLLFIFLE